MVRHTPSRGMWRVVTAMPLIIVALPSSFMWTSHRWSVRSTGYTRTTLNIGASVRQVTRTKTGQPDTG